MNVIYRANRIAEDLIQFHDARPPHSTRLAHDSVPAIVTHAWRHQARKFPNRRSTDSRSWVHSWGFDMYTFEFRIFTTGRGPRSRVCSSWQKVKCACWPAPSCASHHGAQLIDLLVHVVCGVFIARSVRYVLARLIVRRRVVRPRSESRSVRRPLRRSALQSENVAVWYNRDITRIHDET